MLSKEKRLWLLDLPLSGDINKYSWQWTLTEQGYSVIELSYKDGSKTFSLYVDSLLLKFYFKKPIKVGDKLTIEQVILLFVLLGYLDYECGVVKND